MKSSCEGKDDYFIEFCTSPQQIASMVDSCIKSRHQHLTLLRTYLQEWWMIHRFQYLSGDHTKLSCLLSLSLSASHCSFKSPFQRTGDFCYQTKFLGFKGQEHFPGRFSQWEVARFDWITIPWTRGCFGQRPHELGSEPAIGGWTEPVWPPVLTITWAGVVITCTVNMISDTGGPSRVRNRGNDRQEIP